VNARSSPKQDRPTYRWALGVAAWAAGWLGMLWLDGRVDLANLAMALVLIAAVATLWLPATLSVLCSSLSILAFNWSFVPPRGTFSVDLPQDGLLLGSMLLVTWIIAALMSRQRAATQRAQLHARLADQLRRHGEELLDFAEPVSEAQRLQHALGELMESEVTLLLLKETLPATDDLEQARLVGPATADDLAGLWQSARQRVAFGPGTSRYEGLPDWYLPLRGREASFGAAVIRVPAGWEGDTTTRHQAQALCDQFGLALERAASARAATQARDAAQLQMVRNTMLAAISHDYRTPLATILSAASSLTEQGDKMASHQREQLARSISEEAIQLSQLTDNTLQLARLSSPGVELRLDWESSEELIGTTLRRVRRHDPERRVCARLEPGLPLVRCDALLLSQLLNNLVENALKYSRPPTPIEIVVRRQAGHVVFAVQDRGIGVPAAWRERIFDAFQRAVRTPGEDQGSSDSTARPGAGIGLAVCRAIARAHGGDLRYRARARGGSSFEFWLPETLPAPVAVESKEGVQ